MDTTRLTAFPIFAELPAEELRELAAVMCEVEVEPGANVVTHGDDGYAMYAIEQGEAEVLVDGRVAAQSLGPGDAFGEIAFFVTGRRTASVVARTPMRLLWLFTQDFRRVRARVPEFEQALRHLGSERLSR